MTRVPVSIGRRSVLAWCLGLAGLAGAHVAHAAPVVGVVVLHGKSGGPKTVQDLASALKARGMLVETPEMPWSGRRSYDVDLKTGVDEVSKALDALRAKGATRLFVAGHSQGALFAVLFAGHHPVDGVIAIAPGGMVDTPGFVRHLADHVANAKRMRDEGRGADTAGFADFEGRRRTTPVQASAANYLSWFDPQGEHTTRAFGRVKAGVPVLYVAPTDDTPVLRPLAGPNFSALPEHPRKRLLEPNADHMGAPAAAAQDIAAWIAEVAAD